MKKKSFIAVLLCMVCFWGNAFGAIYVTISGFVSDGEGTLLNAMVLANGQTNPADGSKKSSRRNESGRSFFFDISRCDGI